MAGDSGIAILVLGILYMLSAKNGAEIVSGGGGGTTISYSHITTYVPGTTVYIPADDPGAKEAFWVRRRARLVHEAEITPPQPRPKAKPAGIAYAKRAVLGYEEWKTSGLGTTMDDFYDYQVKMGYRNGVNGA